MVALPIAVSLCALLFTLWTENVCQRGERCEPVFDAVSWLGAGFPHALIYALAMFTTWPAALAVMFAMDLLLLGLIWRFLPPRLSGLQISLAMVAWAVASLLTVLATPYLIAGAWELRR